MEIPTAWCDGSWIPLGNVTLSIDDWGVLQAASVVDRLRTVQGGPVHLEEHVGRFVSNCAALGLAGLQPKTIAEKIRECAARNGPAFGETDFSIVMLATPGRRIHAPGKHRQDIDQLTFIVYPTPIPWARLASWYTRGQALVIPRHRNVPAECWSPELKTRSRLHYYLADREADVVERDAGAWLLDTRSNLTETSVANVLIVEDGSLVGPPKGTVLSGVGLKTTLMLAKRAGISYSEAVFSYERAASASEILLCGGSAFLWPTCQLWYKASADEDPKLLADYPQASKLPIYTRLKSAWQQGLGFDYVGQALTLAKTCRLG